jgi:hypothetical protein
LTRVITEIRKDALVLAEESSPFAFVLMGIIPLVHHAKITHGKTVIHEFLAIFIVRRA